MNEPNFYFQIKTSIKYCNLNGVNEFLKKIIINIISLGYFVHEQPLILIENFSFW